MLSLLSCSHLLGDMLDVCNSNTMHMEAFCLFLSTAESHLHLHLFNLLVSNFLLNSLSQQMKRLPLSSPLLFLMVYWFLLWSTEQESDLCRSGKAVIKQEVSPGAFVSECSPVITNIVVKCFLHSLLLTSFASGYLTPDPSVFKVLHPWCHQVPFILTISDESYLVSLAFLHHDPTCFWGDRCIITWNSSVLRTSHGTVPPHAPFIPQPSKRVWDESSVFCFNT